MSTPSADLNPAQQRALALLGALPEFRPTFPPGLAEELREEIDESVTTFLSDRTEPLRVSKHVLATVHGCQVQFLAEKERPFVITVRNAVGTVAHKAIELSAHWQGDATPAELVLAAIERVIENDTWLASWLTTCTDAEQAELEAVAIERVAKFVETFPPLRRHWRPVTESKLRAELAGGMLIVEGKVDLTIGRTIGLVAGKVFVDFKTGGLSATHRDDLRLYALLETLRLGVPPRCVASVYLDQGRVDPEEVTLGVLQAAARRLIVGVRKLVELEQAQTPPQLQPGPACRWCIVAPGCATGQAFLTGQRLEEDP